MLCVRHRRSAQNTGGAPEGLQLNLKPLSLSQHDQLPKLCFCYSIVATMATRATVAAAAVAAVGEKQVQH